jgi:hypothetical protein
LLDLSEKKIVVINQPSFPADEAMIAFGIHKETVTSSVLSIRQKGMGHKMYEHFGMFLGSKYFSKIFLWYPKLDFFSGKDSFGGPYEIF